MAIIIDGKKTSSDMRGEIRERTLKFKEENGYAIPKVLTLSSDSHLYREGLPTKYHNVLYF